MRSSPAQAAVLAAFPRFPHCVESISGSTLFNEFLRRHPSSVVILPGFICADMSLAALAAGKEVRHVDVDISTMHYRTDLLDASVQHAGPGRTLVLFDHAFGHCTGGPGRLKRRFPDVSIIEDAVRVAAGDAPSCVGTVSDALLLSMYKVVRGNGPGAMLLSTRPVELAGGSDRRRVTLSRWLRSIDGIATLVRRFRGPGGDTEPTLEDIERVPKWSPSYGMPDRITHRRFARAWSSGRPAALGRRATWNEIDGLVREIPQALAISTCPDGESCSHYTFVWNGTEPRDRMMARLLAAGVPALRTWDQIPYFFRAMRSTYVERPNGSIELARRVVHVPIGQIGDPELRRLRRIAAELRQRA